MTRSKRSAQKWSRLLDAMDRRSRELYAEAADEPVTPLLLGRPICQILGGHDWEKRGTPVVETVPVARGSTEADAAWDRIRRMDIHQVDVPARAQEPCPVSVGVATDEPFTVGETQWFDLSEGAPNLEVHATCTITAAAGSDITVGDVVTFTGEIPYFKCRRCGFSSDAHDEEERPPTPSVLRGLDALMWWIEHRHEQNGWHWLTKREQSDERAE